MDKDDPDPIQIQFKNVNRDYSQILENLRDNNQNKSKENEQLSDRIIESYNLLNSHLSSIKNDLNNVFIHEIQPCNVREIIFTPKNVEVLLSTLATDLKIIQKDIDEQNETFAKCQAKLEKILKKPN